MNDKFFLSDLEDQVTLNTNFDPDTNFYNEANFETKSFTPTSFKTFLENQNLGDKNLSILNLNIRSMHKNFSNFKSMLRNLNFEFDICLTETWCQNAQNAEKDSNLQLPGYHVIHQVRAQKNTEQDKYTGGGVYFHSEFSRL